MEKKEKVISCQGHGGLVEHSGDQGNRMDSPLRGGVFAITNKTMARVVS